MSAHHRGPARQRVPTRAQLAGPDVRWLKRGGRTKADLKVLDLGQGPLVVKDFADKAGWVRLIGRLQIARECRAYRWLGALAGLPRFAGRVDALALALQYIEGEQLAFVPQRRIDGAATHRKLAAIVESLHRAGLVHLDLRGKDNVLIAADGEVYVLDLASALWLRPGGWAWRLFGRWLEVTDEAALLKWKRILGTGPFSVEEQSFLSRYRFWRALWIFNRKRPPRP